MISCLCDNFILYSKKCNKKKYSLVCLYVVAVTFYIADQWGGCSVVKNIEIYIYRY